MRKTIASIMIFIISLFSSSCGNIETLSSSELINYSGEINTIEILSQDKDGTATQLEIKDSLDKEKLVNLLTNIEVMKLSVRDEIKILDNGKKIADSYIIQFSKKETSKVKILGSVILLPNERIIMFNDIKSMNSPERTISYIPIDNHADVAENIVLIIEKYR